MNDIIIIIILQHHGQGKERKGKERKGTFFKCLVILALEH